MFVRPFIYISGSIIIRTVNVSKRTLPKSTKDAGTSQYHLISINAQFKPHLLSETAVNSLINTKTCCMGEFDVCTSRVSNHP